VVGYLGVLSLPKSGFKLQNLMNYLKNNHNRIIMVINPNNNQFLLYHAKYSILKETLEESITPLEDISSNINLIKEDSSKYFPFIKDVKFIDYWRTTRVIPITTNDERLSRIITYSDKPNFITVFSGKVTTCVKIAKQIKQGLLTGDFNNNMTV
jgi:hypothetical protein